MKNQYLKCLLLLFIAQFFLTVPSQYVMAQGRNIIKEIVIETNIEDSAEADKVKGYKGLALNMCGLEINGVLSQENVANAIGIGV